MLTFILTIMAIYVGIAALILTDKNRQLYTDYQVRNFLRQAKILHQ